MVTYVRWHQNTLCEINSYVAAKWPIIKSHLLISETIRVPRYICTYRLIT